LAKKALLTLPKSVKVNAHKNKVKVSRDSFLNKRLLVANKSLQMVRRQVK